MNSEYWEQFYKQHHEMTPTPFASFCKKWISPKDRVIDVGCGNGRDTFYLNDHAKTEGVDSAILPEVLDTKFYKQDIREFIKKPSKYSVMYSRFFFHAIPDEDVMRLVRWNQGLLCAEFRVKGDSPKIYKDHKRNFIDSNEFLSTLLVFGYDILFVEKGRGLAQFKDEDPLVARVIARRD